MTRRKWGRVLQVLGLPHYLIFPWGYVAEYTQGDFDPLLAWVVLLLFLPCLIIGLAFLPLKLQGDRILKEEDARDEYPAIALPTHHPYR